MASLPSLKPLLQTFRQPTWLAVFTSAGIHGALFAASPSLSSSALTSWTNPAAWNRPHTVPLVELTPEEQGRLPNFSNPSLSPFPDFNQGDVFKLPTTSPPNLSTPFSSDLSAGGLPQNWLGQSTLRQPSTQIFPPSSIIPLDINPLTGLPPIPPHTSYPIPRISTPSNLQSRVGSPRGETPPSTPPLAQDNTPPASSSTPSNQAQPTPNTSPERRLTRLNPDDINQIETGLDNWQADERVQVSLSPDTGALENEPERLQDSGIQTNLSLNAPERESISDRLLGYVYKTELTSQEAATEAISAWTTEVQAQSDIEDLQPQLTELPPIKTPIENPVRVCLPQASTSAMIGILINPEGQIMGQPKLLKSTGYPVLNEWAAQSLGQSLAENPELLQIDSYQALQFEVPITYNSESCVDPTQLTQPHDQPNDQPEEEQSS